MPHNGFLLLPSHAGMQPTALTEMLIYSELIDSRIEILRASGFSYELATAISHFKYFPN